MTVPAVAIVSPSNSRANDRTPMTIRTRSYGQMGDDYSQSRYGNQSDETSYRDDRYGSSWRDERGGRERLGGYESETRRPARTRPVA